MTTNVTFKNQPKLSGFEVDKKRDEQRMALLPYIEKFLSTDELFKDKEVGIEFSHSGVSSLLSFLEVGDKKFVLKIPLGSGAPEGSEALFLKTWEGMGVTTPHIFGEGKIGEWPYILMEFIDAPLLRDVIKEYGENVSVEMGKTFRKLHTLTSQGFGRVVNGEPQYKNFKDWIVGDDMQARFKEVKEKKLLEDEHGSLSKVLETLIVYSDTQEGSTYCHFDFGSSNLLATKPLTVIDPDPILNYAVIDLGRSILIESSGGSNNPGKGLKEGYFSESIPFDEKVLQAAIILNAYYKFPYWYKKDKTSRIENVRRYLAQTRHYLEG